MKIFKYLFPRAVALMLLMNFGCATLEPGPPVKNPQVLKAALPSDHLITGVPWYRQGGAECGPTSLAMVLNYYGKNVPKDEIVRWLMRSGKYGTNVDDLEYYARQQQGMKTFRIYDQKAEKKEMKYLIAQGYPLIALGTIPGNWHRKREVLSLSYHFIVVVGYDDLEKHFIIQDPAYGREGRERTKLPYEVFNDFHTHPRFPQLVLCICLQ